MTDGRFDLLLDSVLSGQASIDERKLFNAELEASGAWVFAGGLQPPGTATVVRADQGEVVLTDGPFVQSPQHLGGFWVIEAADLDAALALAAKGSAACGQPVEVRPFQEEPSDEG